MDTKQPFRDIRFLLPGLRPPGERPPGGDNRDSQRRNRRLEALFFQQTPGVLILPGHSAVTAHFSRLGWLGQGDGQVLRYSFEREPPERPV